MRAILRRIEVSYPDYLREPVSILTPGDLQLGAPGADFERFREDVRRGIEKGSYFIIPGDLVDIASPSNRRAIAGAGLYDSVLLALEQYAEEARLMIREVLEPAKDRILAILSGHHFWQYSDGTTTDTRLAKDLNVPFLGFTGALRLEFVDKERKIEVPFDIYITHGDGSGRLPWSPLQRLHSIANYFIADLYLIGHHHKRAAVPLHRMSVRWYRRNGKMQGVLVELPVHLVGTGGYLKGYIENDPPWQPTYIEAKMLPPAALGCSEILIRIVEDDKGVYACTSAVV